MDVPRLSLPVAVGAVLLLCAAAGHVHAHSGSDRPTYSIAFQRDLVAKKGPIYVVPVRGTIDRGLARYVARATREASADNAVVIVYEIDTFGGLIAAADDIRKTILNASVPTVAYIDKNAASAGALISYAADRIVMVPGASMGAATAVQGATGRRASEKVQSYTRGLMRSTAEANGRDPRLAEAMVDETLAIDSVVAAGRLLTLSASEAVEFGVAEALYQNMNELRIGLELVDRAVIHHEATPAERVLRFFAGSMVQSILMLLMMGGLYFEMQTPGMGVPGATAVLGAMLFFAPNYMLGFVTGWEIVLFLIGVALLIFEMFVIPGFGIAGISGLILTFGALLASLVGNIGFSFPGGPEMTSAIVTMAITMVLLVVLVSSMGRYMPQSKRLSGLVLAPELTSASGYTSANTDHLLVGKTGYAFTALRPAGTVDINGRRVDVVTQGEFVPRGEPVRVMDVQGSRVVVTRTAHTTENETEEST